jgi:monofunctional biosynthetic peptidoglycan transglycosylase
MRLRRRKGALAMIWGWLTRLVLTILLVWAGLIVLYRFVPPVSTLMLARYVTARPVARDWVELDRIAPSLVASVLASEDARFCLHRGVDWTELNSVVADALAGEASRGASTVTMQTVKNTLLWPWRLSARKAVEIPLALVAELVWGKRRTLEIYLNVAEWGEGVFGAQAAARRWFGKNAADLTAREAALLTAILPNPIARRADRPNRYVSARAARIAALARRDVAPTACLAP